MQSAKTIDMTVGKHFDLQIQITYVPYLGRRDDWRKCAWNPKVLVDVDVDDVMVLVEHINGQIDDRWKTIDFDELNGRNQEKIMNFIQDYEEGGTWG